MLSSRRVSLLFVRKESEQQAALATRGSATPEEKKRIEQQWITNQVSGGYKELTGDEVSKILGIPQQDLAGRYELGQAFNRMEIDKLNNALRAMHTGRAERTYG
jgi:hypothetical protein